MEGKRKLIFDTSGVNALSVDSDIDAIIRGVGVAYHVGVTETVFAEVIADPCEDERRILLSVLDRLSHIGHCIMPFQWIIEQQVKAYHRDPKNYEWRNLNVRFAEGEEEIARQNIIHSMSDETRESNKKWDKEFKAVFSAAKPAFQKLFEDPAEKRPSLQAVVEHLMAGGGAYLTIGAGLMGRASGTEPTEVVVKDFIERCPPFKAMLIALCFSQYDRCIRGEREPSLGKAGRYDMYSAVYLAYCRLFITNDDGQYKALTEVAKLMGREVSILMYDQFRDGLFGLHI